MKHIMLFISQRELIHSLHYDRFWVPTDTGRAAGVFQCEQLIGIIVHKGMKYVKEGAKSNGRALEKRWIACVSI